MPETETIPTETVADEVTETLEVEAPDDDTDNADPEPEQPAKKPELGDGGKKAIDAEREARRQAEKQLREARAALKEYEDRDKTELELLRERAESAEKNAAEAERAVAAAEQHALRIKVSAEKGVPAERLAGTTEDELRASADELIAWRDEFIKASTPPKRIPSSDGLKSGASGAESTNPDPKAAAAEALRRMRQVG